MTGYAFYPFLTGIDATESGIYGLRWFDKKRAKGNLRNYVGRTNVQMNKDVKTDILNAFELSAGQYTCSINTYMNRGVAESIKTGFAHTTAKYDGHVWFTKTKHVPIIGKKISKDHFIHETEVTDIAISQLIKNPKVQWITYPSPDAYNHVNGTDSMYQRLLHHLDIEIGRILNEVNRLNQYDRAIAIISDHGISDVKYNLDLCESLQSKGIHMQRGKSASVYRSELVKDIKDLMDLDAYFVINGNLSSYIYLNNSITKNNWGDKCDASTIENFKLKNGKTINFAEVVAKHKGIELVCYRQSDNSVIILSSNGKSIITAKRDSFSYKIIHGDDPLNYHQDTIINAYVNNGYHRVDDFFKNSIHTNYPDAIYRIYNLCIQEKSGDLFLTSKKDYDLAANYEVIVNNYKGGHGGIRKEIIAVPYILYLPGYGSKVRYAMRSED
jgi:hypothetical protein